MRLFHKKLQEMATVSTYLTLEHLTHFDNESYWLNFIFIL